MRAAWRRVFTHWPALLTILAVTACAQLGLQPAPSFPDKLAYAYGVHTAVLSTAATGVTSHTLSPVEGQQVLTLADQSRALLDDAKTLSATDMTAAQSKLVLASAILTQLQTYLNPAGKAP